LGDVVFIRDFRANLAREMKRKGIKAKPLSKAAGLNESAVRDLMGKVDDPRIGTILSLAAALGVSHETLIGGRVPLVGTVGIGGIIAMNVGENNHETVPRPPASHSDLIALRVAGDILFPAYRNGDVVYVAREHGAVESDFVGIECVCQLASGAAYLRTLANGSTPGLYSLRLFNSLDIENEQLAWAAPVLFVMRPNRNGVKKD
jgi:transcriptional regulator with XRE-family HTH domain